MVRLKKQAKFRKLGNICKHLECARNVWYFNKTLLLVHNSGSQLGVVLAPRGQLTRSGGIFGCPNSRGISGIY